MWPSSAQIVDRFQIEHKVEDNVLGKPHDIWYIKDWGQGKHGKYVARIYEKKLAEQACELWNKKKKMPKSKKKRLR